MVALTNSTSTRIDLTFEESGNRFQIHSQLPYYLNYCSKGFFLFSVLQFIPGRRLSIGFFYTNYLLVIV